jgi:protein tyrosine phosphatase (PTP) superfamily phosphohydrolase (DUF442 family)
VQRGNREYTAIYKNRGPLKERELVVIKKMLRVKLMLIFCLQFNVHAGLRTMLTNFNKANREHVRDNLYNFHAVENGGLYRCQQLSPRMLSFYIREKGIKTLINLRGFGKEENDWFAQEKSVATDLGVAFYSIAMSAVVLTEREHLLELLHIFDTAPRPMLVHCHGGADRTGEASALWVLEIQNKSKEEAFKQLGIAYGHRILINSAKDFLIKIWGGRRWLEQEYRATDYPHFCR